MTEAISLYVMVVEAAIPIAIAWNMGNLLVTSFMRMAFKGRVEFK